MAASTHEEQLQIRPYSREDHSRVVELFKSGTMFDVPLQFHAVFATYLAKGLKTDLADIEGSYRGSGGEFWVATLPVGGGEHVVGSIGLKVNEPGEGEVCRLFVDEAYHRRGIGRKLLVKLEQWAKDAGIRRLSLDAGAERDHAQSFYRVHGYEPVRNFVLFQEPLYEATVMVKQL